MTLFEKHPSLKHWVRPLIFALACAFVYGGSVNLGAFDFFPALPFLVFVLYAAWKWRRGYSFACVLLALICVPLYILKGKHDSLFHPSIGMEFRTTEDTCLTLYRDSGAGFVLMSKLKQGKCDSSDMGDAIRWELLPKGSMLTIQRVSVSHADMGEHYVINTTVPLGEIHLLDPERDPLEWPNGKPMRESDLRRGVFYYPSLLMYWPVAPLVIPTLFAGASSGFAKNVEDCGQVRSKYFKAFEQLLTLKNECKTDQDCIFFLHSESISPGCDLGQAVAKSKKSESFLMELDRLRKQAATLCPNSEVPMCEALPYTRAKCEQNRCIGAY